MSDPRPDPQGMPDILEFPLRGEWRASNSPADRVPSHGTDHFGQRFAIDLFQADPESDEPQKSSVWTHLIGAGPASDFLCWGSPIHAASAGTVVEIGDGWFDRVRINLLFEIFRATFLARDATEQDYRPLAGNYLILERAEHDYLLYAHIQKGSFQVSEGERVEAGQVLAKVGNSGNSTEPHLHFQRMDNRDPFKAKGLPYLFTGLERLVNGRWEASVPFLPKERDRFRLLADDAEGREDGTAVEEKETPDQAIG